METGQAVEQPASIVDQFKAVLNPPVESGAPADEPQAQESDAEVEEAAPEATPDAPVIEIDPDAPNFEVRVKAEGGAEETKKVSLTELQKSFMMQADYQRKTAELARQRETLHKEVEDKVKPQVEKYEHNLKLFSQFAVNLAGQELQGVDWAKLSREDPAEFVRLNQRNKEIESLFNYSQQELQKLDQERQAKFNEERDKAAKTAVEVLQDPVSGIPNWSNSLYESVLKTGTDHYGFKFEEVGNVTDPRMIKVLHDAHKYRELQKAKPLVDKKVAAVPKVVKPGSAERSDQTAQESKDLMKRLKSSGKISDAAALFAHRMKRT